MAGFSTSETEFSRETTPKGAEKGGPRSLSVGRLRPQPEAQLISTCTTPGTALSAPATCGEAW